MSESAPAATPASGPPPTAPPAPPSRPSGPLSRRALAALAVGALGLVFGDIGTSPLYALEECFLMEEGKLAAHAVSVTHDNVLGVLALVFWSLVLVVGVKYLLFVLRADNRGEGGAMALLALIPRREKRSARVVVLLALFGAALLYGEGAITPGISVLAAAEGLEVGLKDLKPLVMPLSVLVLLALFLVQRRGVGRLKRAFGPLMLLWFVSIALLGLGGIVDEPRVLWAVNPLYGVRLVAGQPRLALMVLGSVVLCITGVEALYADLGQFGLKPIRAAWLFLVFPALLLNYFGQGAYLLGHGWVENPFYALVPRPLLYPTILLALAATVIASQAVITGLFSLTQQAMQLGYLPRLGLVHTSAEHSGEIYIHEVRDLLMVVTLGMVLAFRSSGAMAAAYGIAVTGAMTITSIVFFYVVTRAWQWPAWKAVPLLLLFLSVAFFAGNLAKFVESGWVPTVVGLSVFAVLTTWKRGRQEMAAIFQRSLTPLEGLLQDLESHPPHRVRGTAVFMSSTATDTPMVLLHHLKHNQVLHKQVLLLSVVTVDTPTANSEEQLTLLELGSGFYRMIWKTGFMEQLSVPAMLERARLKGFNSMPSTTSYFLGRDVLLTGGKSKMMTWRKVLFSFLSRNSVSASTYFGLPPGRVVELGMQVDL